jgi:hypothetical protein
MFLVTEALPNQNIFSFSLKTKLALTSTKFCWEAYKTHPELSIKNVLTESEDQNVLF